MIVGQLITCLEKAKGIPDQNFASLLGDVDSHQLIRDMAEKYLRMVFKNQVFRLLEGKD